MAASDGCTDVVAGKPHVSKKMILDNLEELIASGLITAILLVFTLQIISRNLFEHPFGWPEELSQLIFIWASMLGAVGAAKRVDLVAVDFFSRRLKGYTEVSVRYLGFVLIIGLLLILSWYGWNLAMRTSYALSSLPLTWRWGYVAAPVGGLLMIVRLIQLNLFSYRFVFVESLFRDEVQDEQKFV